MVHVFFFIAQVIFLVPRLSVLVRDQTIRPPVFFMMTLLPSMVFLILEEPWFLGNTQTTNHSKVEIWNLKIWNIQKTIQSWNLFNTYPSPPTTHTWSPNKPPPWRQMVEVHLGEEGCRVFFWHFLAELLRIFQGCWDIPFSIELWSSWIGSLYNRKRQLQIHKNCRFFRCSLVVYPLDTGWKKSIQKSGGQNPKKKPFIRLDTELVEISGEFLKKTKTRSFGFAGFWDEPPPGWHEAI